MTAIEWTDVSWNPVTGCDRVSPGCAHCYALRLAGRLKAMGNVRYQRDGDPKTSGPGFGVTLHEDKLEEPLHWRKPRMVFVNSMSDLFHEEVPWRFVARVFAAMARADTHTFQVLTKRPERMRAMLTHSVFWGAVEAAYGAPLGAWITQTLPNVWLGVSIENRRFVHRADLLRETPAAVRFVSAEPLLGPLVPHRLSCWRDESEGLCRGCRERKSVRYWPRPTDAAPPSDLYWGYCAACRPSLDLTDIDWLIVGGESGPKARPMKPEWVRDLREECVRLCSCSGLDVEENHVHRPAFFFKQWGGRTPKAGGRELDGRTWDEFPVRAAVAA